MGAEQRAPLLRAPSDALPTSPGRHHEDGVFLLSLFEHPPDDRPPPVSAVGPAQGRRPARTGAADSRGTSGRKCEVVRPPGARGRREAGRAGGAARAARAAARRRCAPRRGHASPGVRPQRPGALSPPQLRGRGAAAQPRAPGRAGACTRRGRSRVHMGGAAARARGRERRRCLCAGGRPRQRRAAHAPPRSRRGRSHCAAGPLLCGGPPLPRGPRRPADAHNGGGQGASRRPRRRPVAGLIADA
jgi:hypothetical protein